MSRPSALRETLNLSPDEDHSIDVISVPATGDCFYDCIHELLSRSSNNDDDGNEECHDAASSSMSDDDENVPTSGRLREYVANRLTNEQLEMYRIYADAGFDEYDFANGMTTLADLGDYARRSGRQDGVGPGKCLWADEFALRTVSDWLRLTLLIIDDQATRGGRKGAAKNRKRTRDGPADVVHETSSSSSSRVDDRFVRIGNHDRAVILHRSRRQHYNAVVIDGLPVLDGIDWLPSHLRSLWGLAIVDAKSDETNEERPDSNIEESGDGSREVSLIDQPSSSAEEGGTSRHECVHDECDTDDNSKPRPNDNPVYRPVTTGDEAKPLVVLAGPVSFSFVALAAEITFP